MMEARALFGIRMQDAAYVISLVPELESAALSFKPQPSMAGITTMEQWRGLVSYARAMNALEHRDEESFREHVSQGLWEFPQQGELFGSLVEKFQLQGKMDQWVIDFATPLLESGATETTLSNIIGSRKAVLLVFWAGESEESAQTLMAAQKLSDQLRRSSIVVAAVNSAAGDAENITEKLREKMKLTLPCMIESSLRLLVRQMEITSMPRAILITQQGRVIFHGHPQDQSIWKALKRVAPTIQPPNE